jgi:hypothetical protein
MSATDRVGRPLLGLPVHEVGRQRADAQSGFAPGHATDKSSDLIVKQVY